MMPRTTWALADDVTNSEIPNNNACVFVCMNYFLCLGHPSTMKLFQFAICVDDRRQFFDDRLEL